MNAAAVVVPIVPAIKLQRVLYATDFSEGSKLAWPVVTAIALRYNARVVIAHVCPPSETGDATDGKPERAANKKLTEFLRSMEALGIRATPIVRDGDPVDELEKIVRKQAIDLAVLSTHGRLGVQRVWMGSVAEEFFRNVSCPVLTVGPHLAVTSEGEMKIKNILFPTDLSYESRAVFPYLASLAHEYGAKITLLHVLPPETANNPDAKTLAEPLRKTMERIFGPEISPECETEFVIESGDTAERILRAAHNADLIGLGIRKAGEMATHLRNTVTYRVLVDATCPVLTCRSH